MSDPRFKNIFRNTAKKLLRFSSKALLERVIGFRNLHMGESCYIIGDGISLKYFDLKSLPQKKNYCMQLFHFP